jgi:pyrophosphatase PpaX
VQSLRAVVFDVDGVLVDSREANIKLLQTLMQQAGYKKPASEEILACYHLPLWQTLEKLTGSQDQQEISRIWHLAHDPNLHHVHLIKFPKDLKRTLSDLSDKYRLGVVTGRIKLGLEEIFAASDIGHFFDAIVTFEDYKHPKPHPEPLLLAAKLLEVSPKEAIYVGDSSSDVASARAAGMKSIHICDDDDKIADTCVRGVDGLLEAVGQLAYA